MTRRERAERAAKGSWEQLHSAGKEFKQVILDNCIAPLLVLVAKLIFLAAKIVTYIGKKFNRKG